jgi:hypothetical protein
MGCAGAQPSHMAHPRDEAWHAQPHCAALRCAALRNHIAIVCAQHYTVSGSHLTGIGSSHSGFELWVEPGVLGSRVTIRRLTKRSNCGSEFITASVGGTIYWEEEGVKTRVVKTFSR